MLDSRSYFLLIFYYSMLENLTCTCVWTVLRVRIKRQILFFPLCLFTSPPSLLRVIFAYGVSGEDKSNNKKKLVAVIDQKSNLSNCVLTHVHTEQNRFLLQTKEKFLRTPFLSGSSPRNFISQCIHTNQYVITTAIYNRTNEGLKLEL